MLLTILSWSFRASGHSPANKKSDKYIAAIAIVLLILSGSNTVKFWVDRGRNSLHSNIIALSTVAFFVGTIGNIITSNMGRIKYHEMCSQISSLPATGTQHSKSFLMSVMVFHAIMLISRLALSMYKGLGLHLIISRMINIHVYTVPVIQYLLIVQQLRIVFAELNDRLRASTSHSNISTIFRMHLELQKSVKTVNSYFSLYHLLVDSGRVLYVLSQMYTILVSIAHGTAKISLTEIESTFFQVTYLVITSVHCHLCAQEANKTIQIAHRLLRPDSNEDRIDDVIDFSLSTFNTPVQFSVAGVFTLDNSFITKVTALCLTYLIIALQLS